jgi:hypothetical protein
VDTFKAKINIIGINPFVLLPPVVLKNIFKQSLKDKGPIPIRGTIDGHPYIQTLVKYSGKWRLYINGPMLKAAQKKVGDSVEIKIEFDPVARVITIHPKLEEALRKNIKAKTAFDGLPPSRQKEIIRYISFLKTEAAVERNITRAVQFLLGNSRFIGSDKP